MPETGRPTRSVPPPCPCARVSCSLALPRVDRLDLYVLAADPPNCSRWCGRGAAQARAGRQGGPGAAPGEGREGRGPAVRGTPARKQSSPRPQGCTIVSVQKGKLHNGLAPRICCDRSPIAIENFASRVRLDLRDARSLRGWLSVRGKSCTMDLRPGSPRIPPGAGCTTSRRAAASRPRTGPPCCRACCTASASTRTPGPASRASAARAATRSSTSRSRGAAATTCLARRVACPAPQVRLRWREPRKVQQHRLRLTCARQHGRDLVVVIPIPGAQRADRDVA